MVVGPEVGPEVGTGVGAVDGDDEEGTGVGRGVGRIVGALGRPWCPILNHCDNQTLLHSHKCRGGGQRVHRHIFDRHVEA